MRCGWTIKSPRCTHVAPSLRMSPTYADGVASSGAVGGQAKLALARWAARLRAGLGNLGVIMEEHGSGRSVVAPSFTDGLV